jgi:hypothetical protein
MRVFSNLTKFHMLALAVHCLSPFQPNDTQNIGTNSVLLFYIIQKYYLQMMHTYILCLGVLLCPITPREVTNTSFLCCKASHYLPTSIARGPTFWLAHFDPSPHPLHVSYCVFTTLFHSPLFVFLIGHIAGNPPSESTQFFLCINYSFWIHDISSPKRWTPHVLQKLPHSFILYLTMSKHRISSTCEKSH